MKNNKYLIVANWKQNGDLKSLTKLVNNFIKLHKKVKPRCDVLLLPPTLYLSMILSRLRYHRISLRKISLGVQNISPFSIIRYECLFLSFIIVLKVGNILFLSSSLITLTSLKTFLKIVE